ncbi:MAG TPA: dicarboxylate/amino acid:cation symporter [Verrucomicrobia bacterium]|nr:dicarboxylate/amino acid:cation symporter [Verrucomicrobiota bacterium]HOB32342.1 dicarboxylate/amino acid:cation symporter [Verrucomicrobiota bacterium]HOP96416.1 dicarboxylate/amino acid:cation symporter [Verrucomicrobiota bacterium]
MSSKRVPAHVQILVAIALGVLCGAMTGTTAEIAGVAAVDVYAFFGELFLRALRMIVVPLVVASIATGVAGIGSIQGFGRLGLKTLAYYVVTTLIAVLLGMFLVTLIRPGAGGGLRAEELSDAAAAQLSTIGDRGFGDIVGVIQRFIPENVFEAAARDDMLGLIFFSILFGCCLSRLAPDRQAPVLSVLRGLYEVMLLITELVMLVAPIGVFALVAKVAATTGVDAIRNVALFFVTVLLGLVIQTFVILPLLMRLLAGINPVRHFRAMSPVLLTAFSTASSSATLPVTMECVEKRAGVSNRIASFVVPLGATVNMNGTALYECVAVLFIAQAYGIHLGFAAQFTVVVLALLTSIGVAGVPAASLVAIVIIMNAVGVPQEGLGLILAVDRILDMCRTSVNVFGDTCGAVIIARSEGETGVLESAETLKC